MRDGTPSKYFRTYDVRPGDEFRHHHRYISLAEMFFNLQDQPGFTERLTIISRHDVEAGVAELELAKFLTACGTRFEFRNRTGSSGLDYDLRIFLPDGNELAAESKCKLEGTPYSKGTIANTNL